MDIAAPGVYILSTASDHGYAHMSGTSMAAPMVTGVAAMVYSSRPDLDLIGVKNALLNSARKTDSLAGKVFSGGAGRRGCDGVWERSINLPLSPGNHTISPIHLIKAL